MDEASAQAALTRVWQLHDQGQYRLAIDKLNQLLRREVLPPTVLWRAYELYGSCQYDLGELGKAAELWWQAICRCQGRHLWDQRKLLSNYLFMLHYLDGISDELLRERHFLYGRLCAGIRRFPQIQQAKHRLRIGYISPDFHQHIMASFMIQLLACHDRQRYEIYCYAVTALEDGTTEQLRGLADGWRSLAGVPFAAAAQQIHEDGIDILFDLAGHSLGGFTLMIAACKPAPVQVSGIGYFDTTGLPAMDYYLTDVYCDPPGQNDAAFCETLVRLPHSQLCYTPSEWVMECRQAYQVHRPVVFGSFNNFSKITDQMLALWLQILTQLPGARLILKNPHAQRSHQNRLIAQRAAALGYRPEQLEIRRASGGYLEEYQELDIALDTYPYPGGGTTCEALYMGVPVISLYGQRHGSRFGYSLLMNIGVGELAAATPEEYVAKAVALARDPVLLEGLHQRLRRMMQASPVMDGRGYTREVEAAYERMWQAWLEKR